MRNLYIKRERALACFALPYHCVLGQDIESHLSWVRTQDRDALMTLRIPGSMRNGETCCLSIDEKESSIFVIAYLAHGELVTESLPIPAGTKDLHYTVETRYNGDNQLFIVLLPSNPE